MANVLILPIPAKGDRPTSWIARATLVSSAVVAIFGFFAVSAVLPQIESAFAGEAHAALMTSLIPGVTSIAFAASAPFTGWLIDRYGYKLIYFLSLILFTVVGVSTGFMPSLHWILATRVVTGVAIAGVLNAGSAGIGVMPGKERPGLFGVQAFLGGAAGIPLFPLTGLIADVLGWRWVFSFYLIAVPFVLLCLSLPDIRPLQRAQAERKSVLTTLPTSLLLLGAFLGTAMFLGTAAMPFAVREIGITATKLISVPMTFMSIVSLVGSGGYAFLQRRMGLRAVSAAAVAIIGLGLLTAGMSSSLVALAVAGGILGLGLGTLMPNVNAAGAAACKNAEGRALSLIAASIYGIQAVVPFAFRPLSSAIGLAGVFISVGSLALVFAICLSPLWRRVRTLLR